MGFDFDVSNANTGVIPNIYTVSPDGIGGGFTSDKYCDDGENDKPDCLEVDWLESNGGCGGATTLHTVSGTGEGACNYWGCRSTYKFGGSTFHMKVEYSNDGKFIITRDGQQISGLARVQWRMWRCNHSAHRLGHWRRCMQLL